MVPFIGAVVRQLLALAAALYVLYVLGSYRGGDEFELHIGNMLKSLELAIATLS